MAAPTGQVPDTPSASSRTFLDYVRATVHAKCEHLTEADARRAPLSTSPLMTLAGLVSHLRWVEYFWFQVMRLGEDDHGPWTEEDPDREMRIAVEVPIAQLLEEYEAQCARHRELVASLDLVPRPSGLWVVGPSRCAGSCSIWSRRPPGTTGTSTSCASWPMA